MDNEEITTPAEAKELYKDQISRWKRLWACTFAALAVTLGGNAIVVNLLLDASEVRGEEISRIETALIGIESNQSGIEELVSFVRDVAEAQQEGEDLEVPLTTFVDLLCASEDPIRIAACQALPAELKPDSIGGN